MNDNVKLLADIARLDIGLREDPVGSNRGKDLVKFKLAAGFDAQDAEPWCAMAVCYWVQQFLKQHPEFKTIRPITGRAFGLIEWGRYENAKVFSGDADEVPQVGDIVVYHWSHCGVVSQDALGGSFLAIEGNTNDDGSRDGYEVCQRHRLVDSRDSFIRIQN